MTEAMLIAASVMLWLVIIGGSYIAAVVLVLGLRRRHLAERQHREIFAQYEHARSDMLHRLSRLAASEANRTTGGSGGQVTVQFHDGRAPVRGVWSPPRHEDQFYVEERYDPVRHGDNMERHAARIASRQDWLGHCDGRPEAYIPLASIRCRHPHAEPVDLNTGERVAWVCPDCGTDLPADFSPPGGLGL